MNLVFVDTSAWYEFADARAARHGEVAAVVDAHRGRLCTTTYVLAELAALVAARLGREAAAVTGRHIRESPDVEVIHPSAGEEEDAWRLFLARPDKGYSLTDCVSFTIMRRLGTGTALATDRHFAQEGFSVLP